MVKESGPPGKKQTLKRQGAFNPHPERVVEPLFGEHDFFDPCDLVQVKYEMLRQTRLEGRPLSEAARSFGFSRPSFYKAQDAFAKEGIAGLLPRRRGPRSAHKLGGAVLEFLQRALTEDASLRPADLVGLLEERFGLRVHSRSIERAVARLEKKRHQPKAEG